MGKATREVPAQAELRPTSAGAFGVILLCDVTPHESRGSIGRPIL
jgi:hypothetical protein